MTPKKGFAPQVYAADREEWRAWLKANHASVDEIYLVLYKKGTGKPSVGYMESVEEALCYGWIDGIKKRIDDERYMHRFSPRKPTSKWSATNIKLARKLIANRRMRAAGKAAFERRLVYDSGETPKLELTPEMTKALRANKKAWAYFNSLTPGYRKQYVAWLVTAKRPETREKRLKEAIRLLSQSKKLGMK